MGTAAILLAIAALGGAVMAAIRIGGKRRPPTALAIVHGLIAATGLITLIIAVKGQEVTTLLIAAIIGLIIAALVGLVLLFRFHLFKKAALPIPLIVVHVSVAVISFTVVLGSLYAVSIISAFRKIFFSFFAFRK